MPVRNERETIESVLDDALAQKVSTSFEVIVADGGSSDGTRAVLDKWAERDARIHVCDNPGRTAPCGLNVALAAARGRYWVRLDGHSAVPPDYVERLVAHLRSGNCDAAGAVVRGLGTTTFGHAVAAAHDSRFGIGNASHHYARSAAYVDHVTHGAYRVDRSRAVGGFDESLVRNQDYDFDYRYAADGSRILLDPTVVFERRVRETPAALARQFHDYGYWKYVVLRRHPGSLHVRWLVPPVFVTVLGGAALFSWSRPGRRVFTTVAGAYAGTVGIAAVTLRRKAGYGRTRHAALALAIMHTAWGGGFVRSLLRNR